MADPAHLEAVAKAMYSSHQGVRLGSYFFGLIITICLQTLAVSQFAKWCTTSWSSERGCFRFLTIYMIVSGMGFTVTQCVRCFDVFVANYGEYGSLLSQAIPRFLTVFMTTAHLGSEAFYIHRAYVLSGRSRTLVGAFGILWFALLVVSGVAIAKIPPLLTDYGQLQFALFTAQGALLMVVDVSITLLTIYFLYRRRDEQRGTPANSLIHRLIRLSVETQLPVSVVAIISTTLLASGCVWFTPVCTALICGLSQVTLFKVLNSRRDIREREGLVTTAGPAPPTTQRICNKYGVPYLDYKAGSSSGSDRASDDKPPADDNLYFGSRPHTV